MFTGIVETTAKVMDQSGDRLTIERPKIFDDVRIGSSISVSGVCLSIVSLTASQFSFNVVPETKGRSTIGSLKKGDTVNLERSLAASGRFEGHIVQGHTEGTGTVEQVPSSENDWICGIRIPDAISRLIIEKGSVAVDGVSLTVVSLDETCMTVALIPHTLDTTTLGHLRMGDNVNIESDILGRYVSSLIITS